MAAHGSTCLKMDGRNKHRSDNELGLRGGSLDGMYKTALARKRAADKLSKEPKFYGTVPTTAPRKPYIPPGGEYEALPADSGRMNLIARLGIDESQVRPADVTTEDGLQGSRHLYTLLSGRNWRPTRLGFRMRWPGKELDTEWYHLVYVHLILRVADFVDKYFAYGDIEVAGRQSVWREVTFSRQFLDYVSHVAVQDNSTGGWEVLLSARLYRQYLVRGVIAKVLNDSVFDSLLVGVEAMQNTMFDAQDECTIGLEGYHRTDLRSHTVRVILTNETLPPHFWPAVDRLAYQMTALLLPLVQLMDRHFPESRLRSLRGFYQDLHHIVSEAGYLSVGIRWSRHIFRFTWPVVGQGWELDQTNIDNSVFQLSRTAREADDEAEAERARRERRQARREAWRRRRQGTRHPGFFRIFVRGFRSSLPISLVWPLAEEEEAGRRATPAPSSAGGDDTETEAETERQFAPSYLAKVQIVCWPALQRYAPTSPVSEGVPLGENITNILNAQVVYYQGRIDKAGEQAETVASQLHTIAAVEEEREPYQGDGGWDFFFHWGLIALGALWNFLLEGLLLLAVILSISVALHLLLGLAARYFTIAERVFNVVSWLITETTGRFAIIILDVLIFLLSSVIYAINMVFWFAYAVRGVIELILGRFTPWASSIRAGGAAGLDSSGLGSLHLPRFNWGMGSGILNGLEKDRVVDWVTCTLSKTIFFPTRYGAPTAAPTVTAPPPWER